MVEFYATINETILSGGQLRFFFFPLKNQLQVFATSRTLDEKAPTCQFIGFQSSFCIYPTNNKVVSEAAGRRAGNRGDPTHPGFGVQRCPLLVFQATHPRGKLDLKKNDSG